MSEFTVCRTVDTYQALRYCLLLDGIRIAGGKPDYRGDNILISWNTKETYGAVDELMKENAKLRGARDTWQENDAKLRELVRELWFYAEQELVCDDNCPYGSSCDWKDCVFTRRMRELGMEVE